MSSTVTAPADELVGHGDEIEHALGILKGMRPEHRQLMHYAASGIDVRTMAADLHFQNEQTAAGMVTRVRNRFQFPSALKPDTTDRIVLEALRQLSLESKPPGSDTDTEDTSDPTDDDTAEEEVSQDQLLTAAFRMQDLSEVDRVRIDDVVKNPESETVTDDVIAELCALVGLPATGEEPWLPLKDAYYLSDLPTRPPTGGAAGDEGPAEGDGQGEEASASDGTDGKSPPAPKPVPKPKPVPPTDASLTTGSRSVPSALMRSARRRYSQLGEQKRRLLSIAADPTLTLEQQAATAGFPVRSYELRLAGICCCSLGLLGLDSRTRVAVAVDIHREAVMGQQ